jgi:CRISPR/Cas system-associated exonuclease Cas4 (RecB family)
MLRSFYVDGSPPPEAETDRLNEKLTTCHQHLLAASHWERLRQCGWDGCLFIPPFAHVFIGGVKAFAAADMAYVHEGVVHLIDWKSGRPGDDDELQVALAVYALLEDNPALKHHQLRVALQYLLPGEERQVTLPDDLRVSAEEKVAAGVKKMHSFLRDVEANAPLEVAEFPRRESGLCPSCNFSQLCTART